MAQFAVPPADAAGRVAIDTARLPWQASPAAGVWRKRLFHDGPAERGRVTSLVRFDPGARFPVHAHPDGESILVLDGTFSDKDGDWPAGTYLFNPDGSRHAPWSATGCLLLVRLRQHPGGDRARVAVDTGALPWQPSPVPGIEARAVAPPGSRLPLAILRFAPGVAAPARRHAAGAMLYVLAGALEDETGRHAAGSWLFLPPGIVHHPHSPDGCMVFLDADFTPPPG